MASLMPALLKSGSRLSREYYICNKCMRSQLPVLSKTARKIPVFRVAGYSNIVPLRVNGGAALGTKAESPLKSLSERIKKAEGSTQNALSKASFPKISSKSVAYWLLGSAASVFGIVVFGGLTRLTESGYVKCVPLTSCY
jgi:heme a synthase